VVVVAWLARLVPEPAIEGLGAMQNVLLESVLVEARHVAQGGGVVGVGGRLDGQGLVADLGRVVGGDLAEEGGAVAFAAATAAGGFGAGRGRTRGGGRKRRGSTELGLAYRSPPAHRLLRFALPP